jgi:hypothetical protein
MWFSFEKEPVNVEDALRDLKVAYPVAIDSNFRIWQAFNNEYWPAQYLIDGKGRIRYHHFEVGDYVESERTIQDLLKENGATGLSGAAVSISADGVEAAPSADAQSPETYLGYLQAERFASPERLAQDSRKIYSPPVRPSLNRWGLSGSWSVGGGRAVLQETPGTVVFRFQSRDLHVVLGPTLASDQSHGGRVQGRGPMFLHTRGGRPQAGLAVHGIPSDVTLTLVVDIQELLARLEQHEGCFPEDLVAQVLARREQATPRFLEILSRTSSGIRNRGWQRTGV